MGCRTNKSLNSAKPNIKSTRLNRTQKGVVGEYQCCVDFTKQGKWVFKEMADGYKKDFANSKQQLSMALDQMPQNQMQVMMVMGMVESVLTTFENAKTPEEIQMAVQQVAPMLGGLMMGGAMMGGQQPAEIQIEPKKK